MLVCISDGIRNFIPTLKVLPECCVFQNLYALMEGSDEGEVPRRGEEQILTINL